MISIFGQIKIKFLLVLDNIKTYEEFSFFNEGLDISLPFLIDDNIEYQQMNFIDKNQLKEYISDRIIEVNDKIKSMKDKTDKKKLRKIKRELNNILLIDLTGNVRTFGRDENIKDIFTKKN